MDPSAFSDLQRRVRPQLELLTACSRWLAADEEHVIAGGGNTSVKSSLGGQSFLFVKRSGTSLRHIRPDDFVSLTGTGILTMLRRRFSRRPSVRESQYKEALMASRVQPSLDQRPSVESAMHMATPYRFTFHLHTSLVNMITCCVRGRAVTTTLFGDQVRFLNYVFPGIRLAQAVASNVTGHRFKPRGHRQTGQVYFLGNHGVIFAADEAEIVFALIEQVTTAIRTCFHELLARQITAEALQFENGLSEQLCRDLVEACNTIQPKAVMSALHLADGLVSAALGAPDAEVVAHAGPLTPDQIVYCGPAVLWLAKLLAARQLKTELEAHLRKYGDLPKVVLHPRIGLVTLGANAIAAQTTQLVYHDTLRITQGARMLGGVKPLSIRRTRAINDWEVEAYRRNVSATETGPRP